MPLPASLVDYRNTVKEYRELFLDCWTAISALRDSSVRTNPAETPSGGYVQRRATDTHIETLSAANIEMTAPVELGRSLFNDIAARNAVNGINLRFIGNQLLVAFYSDWDERARGIIAGDLGLPNADSLKHDIWGDLRKVRHDIVHNKGKASRNGAAQLAIFECIVEGNDITWDIDRWKETFEKIIEWISSYE